MEKPTTSRGEGLYFGYVKVFQHNKPLVLNFTIKAVNLWVAPKKV